MKVKFAGRVYDVIDTRTLPGGLVQYGIEDEPGHIDWLINVEIVDDGNSGYGFKSSGASYPTKPVCFDGELIGSFALTGHYDSRDEIEKNAPRESGGVAATNWATYTFDGKEWLLATLSQYVTFKVKSRAYIAGRGYVTVVHNPDLLPIDRNKSAVCKGQFRLPIHGIERTMTLMTIPRVMPDWGLITSEETIGDEITIRMYPDEIDEPVNKED